MNIHNPSALQAIAFQMIPSTHHRSRNREIVGYGLQSVAPAQLVTRRMAGIGRPVFSGGMLARSNGDNDFALGLELVFAIQIVCLSNRLGGCPINTRD